MLDHITFGANDLRRALAFYDVALAPLGVKRLLHVTAEQSGAGAFAGYGEDRPYFWIGEGEGTRGPLHVAFAAESRADVDAFYWAALTAGGRDNGPPGVRPHYAPDYYAAFVLDPDGHNIEAVCRKTAG